MHAALPAVVSTLHYCLQEVVLCNKPDMDGA